MNESQTKDMQPLLVVKYEIWKVLWGIFIPHFFVVLIGILLGSKLILSGDIAGGVFFSVMAIVSVSLSFELLMIKEFVFYHDKIVKVWKLLGSKEIKYSNAVLEITSRLGITNRLSMYSFSQKIQHFYKNIVINRTMISANTEKQIMEFVSQLLNQDVSQKLKSEKILRFDFENQESS